MASSAHVWFPKPDGGLGWNGWRFISKTSHLQKTLLRAVVQAEHERLADSNVCTLGFRPHMSCHMIHFAVTQCLRLSRYWQNAGLCIASMDVYKAFDVMQQSATAQLLLARGWTLHGVTILLAHMGAMVARPELDGAKPVPEFAYNLGGRQRARKRQSSLQT